MHIQVSDKPIWLISILIMALSENGWHPPKDHFSRTAGGSPMDLGVPCCFPTCQVRGLWAPELSTAGPQQRAPDRGGHNRELQISVGTAGPQLREPDVSGHCRTSAVSARAQWALPDLNCESQISVGTAGPQLQVQDVTQNVRRDVR